jgi:hypothetical protein
LGSIGDGGVTHVQERFHRVVMFDILGEASWVRLWEDVDFFLNLRKKAHGRL